MHALTDSEIQTRAPSIAGLPKAAYATGPAPGVSAKYLFVPTLPLIEALDAAGFEVYKSSQKRTRKPGMDAFAGHEITLRPNGTAAVVGELTPEIIIQNSHNTQGALKFKASVNVFWCANGCSRAVSGLMDIRVRHTGAFSQGDFIEGAGRVLERSVEWAKTLTEWQAIPMDMHDRLEFAEQALALRYPQGNAPVEAPMVLQVRHQRDYDLRDTLFGAFNTLQGNLIQTGIPLRNSGRRSLRKVTGDSFHKYNEELAKLAEGYASRG